VLHVVDASASDEEQDRQREAVDDVLHEIGAGELPVVVVLNKIDRVDPLGRRRLANRFPDAAQVSALTGEGLEELKAELARRFEDRWERVRLLVPYAEGGRLAELYALGTPIEEREDTENGVLVVARLPRRELPRFAPFLIAESRTHRETA
jgi:GTP-binding protein HflX